MNRAVYFSSHIIKDEIPWNLEPFSEEAPCFRTGLLQRKSCKGLGAYAPKLTLSIHPRSSERGILAFSRKKPHMPGRPSWGKAKGARPKEIRITDSFSLAPCALRLSLADKGKNEAHRRRWTAHEALRSIS